MSCVDMSHTSSQFTSPNLKWTPSYVRKRGCVLGKATQLHVTSSRRETELFKGVEQQRLMSSRALVITYVQGGVTGKSECYYDTKSTQAQQSPTPKPLTVSERGN
jgi:hypothetical protein